MKYDLMQHVAGTCIHFRRKATRCAAGLSASQVQDPETHQLPCKVTGTDQIPPCMSREFRTDEAAQAKAAELVEMIADALER